MGLFYGWVTGVLPAITAIKYPLLRKHRAVAFFTKEVNPRLAKRPLKSNGRLANRGLTSFVKDATVIHMRLFYVLAKAWPMRKNFIYQIGNIHGGAYIIMAWGLLNPFSPLREISMRCWEYELANGALVNLNTGLGWFLSLTVADCLMICSEFAWDYQSFAVFPGTR